MNKISYIFPILFIAFGLLYTGCDSTETAPETKTVNGTWKALNSDELDVVEFIQINLPIINNFNKKEKRGCYYHYSFKVNKLSGDNYLVVSSESNKGDTLTFHVEMVC